MVGFASQKPVLSLQLQFYTQIVFCLISTGSWFHFGLIFLVFAGSLDDVDVATRITELQVSCSLSRIQSILSLNLAVLLQSHTNDLSTPHFVADVLSLRATL
jgi:hypothetical protein